MAAKVDLYNSSYGNYALSAYSEIRFETVWRGLWPDQLGYDGGVS